MSKLQSYRKFIEKNESNIMFGLHFLFAGSIAFSESLISIFSGFYVLYIALTVSYKRHYETFMKNGDALFLISIFLIYILGLFFSNDIDQAIYELRKTMFWWIFPIGIASTKRISAIQLRIILYLFVLTVTISSGISFYRYLNSESLGILNFRDISLLSHISFSIIIAFSILVIFYLIKDSIEYKIKGVMIFLLITCVWLIFMLIIVNSLIGIIAFGVTLVFVLYWSIKRIKSKLYRIVLYVITCIIVLMPVVYVAGKVHAFYDLPKIEKNEIEKFTSQGNRYTHYFNQFEKENGNWVYLYICRPELRVSWEERSNLLLDGKTKNNQSLYGTLIRYLTSKELRKDAGGVAQLNSTDIENIENGIANYIYAEPSQKMVARIYETIWELDVYFHTGNARNKTFAQRIDQVKLALKSIERKPLFGVGTGDAEEAGYASQKVLQTNLPVSFLGKPHLQYLTYCIKFGIIGMAWILFAILFPIFKYQGRYKFLLSVLVVLYLVANFGDNQWENHVALPVFVFFYSFFKWGVK